MSFLHYFSLYKTSKKPFVKMTFVKRYEIYTTKNKFIILREKILQILLFFIFSIARYKSIINVIYITFEKLLNVKFLIYVFIKPNFWRGFSSKI